MLFPEETMQSGLSLHGCMDGTFVHALDPLYTRSLAKVSRLCITYPSSPSRGLGPSSSSVRSGRSKCLGPSSWNSLVWPVLVGPVQALALVHTNSLVWPVQALAGHLLQLRRWPDSLPLRRHDSHPGHSCKLSRPSASPHRCNHPHSPPGHDQATFASLTLLWAVQAVEAVQAQGLMRVNACSTYAHWSSTIRNRCHNYNLLLNSNTGATGGWHRSCDIVVRLKNRKTFVLCAIDNQIHQKQQMYAQ